MTAFIPLHASVVSGNVVLTSDYVFRGISQTDASVAPQVGAWFDVDPGLYASAWASRVDFASVPQASSEIDYAIGWRRNVGSDWSADLNATWFTYAGAAELNYLEWIATATWRGRHWITLGASQDVFATGRTGVYAQTGVRIPVDDALRFELAGGYYWLDRPYGRSYAHAQATVAWQVQSNFEIRLLGHITNHSARDIFGGLARPRVEAAIQASF